MNHPSVLTEVELMRLFGCKRRSALENLLRSQGIPVLYGRKGQIVTTITALNTAMGLGNADDEEVIFK